MTSEQPERREERSIEEQEVQARREGDQRLEDPPVQQQRGDLWGRIRSLFRRS